MEETPAPVAAPPPAAPRVGQWRNPWLVLALGALGALAVAGWAILDLRDQIGETRQGSGAPSCRRRRSGSEGGRSNRSRTRWRPAGQAGRPGRAAG